jgi:hypothetical protein
VPQWTEAQMNFEEGAPDQMAGSKMVQRTPQEMIAAQQAWTARAPQHSVLGRTLQQAGMTAQFKEPYEQIESERALKKALALKEAEIAGREPKQPAPGIQEYNFAKQQGYPGSYMDFIKSKKEATTIFAPKPEPRERFQLGYDKEGNGVRINMDTGETLPLQGVGKAAGAAKKSARAEKEATATSDLLDKISAAEQGLPYASGAGSVVPAGVRQLYTDENTKMADANISALGAEQAHALYGAAFTASEQARAAQFLPVTTGITPDTADTIKSKLKALRMIAEKKQARINGQPDPHPKMYNDILEGGTKPIAAPAAAGKTVVREVPLKDGRTGVEYSDGTRGYK